MHFQVFQSPKDQQFYFHLKASNGRILLQSIAYLDSSSCEKGIESARNAINNPNCFIRKKTSTNQFYFNLHLHALNEQVIGRSQMYSTKRGMEKGIQRLVNFVLQANVVYLPHSQ